MEKSLRYLLASLLCAMTLGANAQTATDSYLDVTNYASINTAGFNTNVIDKLYYWDENSGTLVVNVFGAYQSLTNQTWVTVDGSGSSARTWTAPDGSVFKGSSYYFTTKSAKTATGNTDRTYKFAVTNVTEVSALVKSGNKSRYAVLSVYEGQTLVGSAQDNTNAVAIISVDGLDASKTYSVELSGSDTSNSDLYEVAFVADTGKQEVEISFGQEYYSASLRKAFNSPTATVVPSGLALTYESSNEDVASVDASTGVVTLNGVGTTTITASFAGNDNYKPGSGSYLLSVADGALLIDFPNIEDGLYPSGSTTLTTVNIHENKDAVKAYSFTSGYTNDGVLNGNCLELNIEGGFKVGDVLTIAGVFNNSDDSKNANVTLFTTLDGEKPSVIKNDYEPFINGRTSAGDPVDQVYTLEENYDVLYLGRSGNTATYLTKITLVRQKEAVEYTFNDYGIGTLYYSNLRFDELPEGVTASIISGIDGKTLQEETLYNNNQASFIPSGNGVILRGEPNSTVTLLGEECEAEGIYGGNMLLGTDEAETVDIATAQFYYYVLSAKNGEVGFYWAAEDGGSFENGAHKAYLALTPEQAALAPAFYFEGSTTGIAAVEGDNTLDANAPMYNIAGQRVNGSYKGIVIQNGVKRVK